MFFGDQLNANCAFCYISNAWYFLGKSLHQWRENWMTLHYFFTCSHSVIVLERTENYSPCVSDPRLERVITHKNEIHQIAQASTNLAFDRHFYRRVALSLHSELSSLNSLIFLLILSSRRNLANPVSRVVSPFSIAARFLVTQRAVTWRGLVSDQLQRENTRL